MSGGADLATRAFELVLGGSLVGYAIDVWKTRRSDRRDAAMKAKTDAREDVREPLTIESLQQAARKEELALSGMLREQLLRDLERVTAEREGLREDLEEERRAREADRATFERREQLLHDEIGRLRDTIEHEREEGDRRYLALLQRLEALQASITTAQEESTR